MSKGCTAQVQNANLGRRPDVNERYYGTMIKDLDGHTIEVVHWMN